MDILVLFSNYFLILVITQGLVTSIIDYRSFKKAGMNNTARKARIIGIGEISISLVMYFIARTLY